MYSWLLTNNQLASKQLDPFHSVLRLLDDTYALTVTATRTMTAKESSNSPYTGNWIAPHRMYQEISHCRICGNPELDALLDLGMQALTGVFPRHREEEVAYGPLQLVKCREGNARNACGLTQLKHSFQASMMYGANYGYRSGLNASMVQHLQAK